MVVKAGGGPGYRSEIKPEIYIKKFNWLNNWIQRHFFNKVSDTLLGIIFISLFVLFIFKYFSKSKKTEKLKLDLLMYSIPLLFLLEWFLNHPSMRYGGYTTFCTSNFFLLTSTLIQMYKIKKETIKKSIQLFLLFWHSLYLMFEMFQE